MSFFKTPEFRFFKKIKQHVEVINTQKNVDVYIKYLDKCKAIAKDKYKNIGWREDTKSYAWDKLDLSTIGPILINCGDENGLSFYPGATIFMSEDLLHWVLKHNDNTVVRYTPEETNSLREKSIKQLREIHEVKKNFEGKVLNDDEKNQVDELKRIYDIKNKMKGNKSCLKKEKH